MKWIFLASGLLDYCIIHSFVRKANRVREMKKHFDFEAYRE
jgi:hypothetical protein